MSPARPRSRAFPLSGSVLIAVIGGLAFGASSAAAVAPVCNDVSYTVESEQTLALPINGPCTDSDGPSSLQGQLVTSPAHGTISPGPNGGGIYRSANNYSGPDSFTFRASDGAELSNVATTTITVTPGPGNHAPVCSDSSLNFTVGSDRNLRVPVTPNCSDEDGDPLRMSIVSAQFPERITVAPDGSGTYRAPAGFVGPDSFSFRADDGSELSNQVDVAIDVTAAPPNELPFCPEQTAFVESGSSS